MASSRSAGAQTSMRTPPSPPQNAQRSRVSPVSPISQPTISPILTNGNGNLSTSNTIHVPPPSTTASQASSMTALPMSPKYGGITKRNWMPFTLRWQFLLLPMAFAFLLCIILALLVWYSHQHYGLGVDNGSSAVLFGWRFTPTLIAVLYAQITVIIFEDVKRTEPFARMAKPPPGGASAEETVLETSKPWWTTLYNELFRKKKGHKRSWALICSAIINIIAILVISPLSSALLVSDEIVIPKSMPFTRMIPKAQLSLKADRGSYFRTMATTFQQNLSTSAWVSDASITLPFWVSSEQPQLGPRIESTYSSWNAETTRFSSDFKCQNMSVTGPTMSNKTFSALADVDSFGGDGKLANGTATMMMASFSSDDGCKYELTLHPTAELAYYGGLIWSNTSTYFVQPDAKIKINFGHSFYSSLGPKSPYARMNSTKECRDRDIIIMSTPWQATFIQQEAGGPGFLKNKFGVSKDLQMRAYLCESQFTMAKMPISAAMSPGLDSKVQAKGTLYVQNDTEIPETIMDTTRFQSLVSGQDDWSRFLTNIKSDPKTTEQVQPLVSIDEQQNQRMAGDLAVFAGPARVLGALANNNIKTAMSNPDLVDQAARLHGRFFGEVLQAALAAPGSTDTEPIQGTASTLQTRVIVITGIGIALSVLAFISFFLLLVVFWFSRLARRPLNLSSDPASTVGTSVLLDPRRARTNTLRSMHKSSKSELHGALRAETFQTLDRKLHHIDSGMSRSTGSSASTSKKSRDWRPIAIRLRSLLPLAGLLAAVLVALVVLDSFSQRSRLYQVAFVYEVDIPKLGAYFSKFAPISIAPTIIGIAIGLWWDQVDMTFRILQPYISMSREETPICAGAGLTYRSKTWVGAAVKAARNRHWVLFLIAVGSTLCQVLTVSLSALFDRQPENVLRHTNLERTLELRQNPIILNGIDDQSTTGSYTSALQDLFTDPSKNSMYGAAIQMSLNGSQLSWTRDGWSFIPLELTNVPGPSSFQRSLNSSNDAGPLISSTNVTFDTSAIRARLDCKPVDEISNLTSWLIVSNETNSTTGETTALPTDRMFEDFSYNTSTLSGLVQPRCCLNGTNSTQIALGYWTWVNPEAAPTFEDSKWPTAFMTKWIRGKGAEQFVEDFGSDILYFEDLPKAQAALCTPIIETNTATVTVDKNSGQVFSYEMLEGAASADSAWTDVFVTRQLGNTSQRINESYAGPVNLTTSYGVMFMDFILSSALTLAPPSLGFEQVFAASSEDLNSEAFNFRDEDNGINLDLMTYSMYSLVGKDADALLNYTTLVDTANMTIQTFFQHFVQNRLSLTEGGWAYQRIGDDSIDSLGDPVTPTEGTALAKHIYPKLNTNRTAIATVSNRVQVLKLDPTATWLSVSIVAWLIITTIIIAALQRSYTGSLIRNVESIADILVLTAGSDNFLRMVQQRGVEFKKEKNIKTKLGWFKGRDGEVRWGIEIVGGRDPVEWVSAPSNGSAMVQKSPTVRSLASSSSSSSPTQGSPRMPPPPPPPPLSVPLSSGALQTGSPTSMSPQRQMPTATLTPRPAPAPAPRVPFQRQSTL
ncbi:hypothetical protein BDV96DRAFT_644835 [Lophiotrema nucula]|uniref:Uncharacterized protein n=1 Tax=Lophiotrema nucula TaxID=690887 RepID=A0A6A5ZD89_9PLEO|nr:hypothetical protein BDV96DRAFT_644835 [Lophiotrema nucula]